MAWRVRWNWSTRIRLAGALALDLSQARAAPTRFESRARLHPQRSSGLAGQNQMVCSASPAANLGVRRREIPDRSRVVVLSFLDSRFLAEQTWPGADRSWPADRGDLFDLRRWQRRRWVGILVFDQARPQRKRCPQN